MCGHLEGSSRPGSGDIDHKHSGQPDGCVPGCCVPTLMHSTPRDYSTQARVPVHLGIHNWATQVVLTWLFAQVILGLGSLTQASPVTQPVGTRNVLQPSQAAPADTTVYTPIPPDRCIMVTAGLYPGGQTDGHSSSSHPIFLGNDTDSGISSVEHLTPVKALGTGCQTQHLTSIPKLKPKLLTVAWQQTNELVAMRQGAPHGAHMKADWDGTAQTNSWVDWVLWTPVSLAWMIILSSPPNI